MYSIAFYGETRRLQTVGIDFFYSLPRQGILKKELCARDTDEINWPVRIISILRVYMTLIIHETIFQMYINFVDICSVRTVQ